MTRSALTLVRPLALTVAGVAVLSAIGLTAANTDDGTVALTLDGQTTTVSLDGETVGDVLDAEGLEVGEHDLLSPSADTELSDGDKIALRRAKEVQLDVDGTPRTVFVHADSVDEALDAAGIADGVYVSASRSRSLTDGLALQVRTPKRILLVADGRVAKRTTTAATVWDALKIAKVAVRPQDKLEPAASTRLRPGMGIKVTRRSVVVEKTAAGAVRRADSSMTVGETTVLRAGTSGTARRTYELRTVAQGKQVRVLVASTTLTAPRKALVAYGTKAKPQRAYVASADGLNWAALAACESGGNPSTNTGNGYYGMYQFSLPTWRGVGGSGLPSDASASEQTMRAQTLYKRSGAGQWPVCGKRL